MLWTIYGYMKSNMRAYYIASVMSNSLEGPWIVVRQAPLSMGFPRQEHWSGLPCPPPDDLFHPGINRVSCGSCIASSFFAAEPLGKPLETYFA